MKILFSYPIAIDGEAVLINELMKSREWNLFHLRKPDWNDQQVESLYHQLNDAVKSKTVLHRHQKLAERLGMKKIHARQEEVFSISTSASCHSFEEVEEIEGKVEYCFLSPIYDSISKPGYSCSFIKSELKQFLKKERKTKIIALGGVDESNYQELLRLGFDGGAFLGSIWNQKMNVESPLSNNSL